MALQVSTGFKTAILGDSAFEDIFNGGAIGVYTGVQPSSADNPVTGTRLGLVTLDGKPWTSTLQYGLRFVRNGPFAASRGGDTWLLVPALGGIAGYWRLFARPDDDGTLSYSRPRIDGAIGDTSSTAEMRLADTSLSAGIAVPIRSFFYTIPPIVGS